MILKRANGTDITNDLLGLRRDTGSVLKKSPPLRRHGSEPGPLDRKEKGEFGVSSELEIHLDKEKLKRASTQVAGVTSKIGSQSFFISILPGGSIASTMDYINSNFFQPGEMACHVHSDYAKRKLASLVIARIDNSDDGGAMGLPSPNLSGQRNGPASPPGSPTGMVMSSSPAPGVVFPKSTVPFLLQAPSTRRQFRRYVLIEKVNIGLGEQPVVAFTFSPVHAVREDFSLPTLPGQYVELMSEVRKEMVKRPYNVVRGSLSTDFTIYVKNYANGKMSSHLNLERQVKMEISVRGPFDITHRIEAADIIYRRPRDVDPNLAPRQDSIMLNPERADGRWRHVYSIVGGTGITPILQLIKYYQYILQEEEHNRHAKSANSAPDSPQDTPIVTWIHILFANTTVLDVFESGRLESLATDTGNRYLRITIIYIFSEPPEKWEGLSGFLDLEKVEDWVRSRQEKMMPSTNEYRNNSEPVQGGLLFVRESKNRGAIRKSHSIGDITQSSSAGLSPRDTSQRNLRPQLQWQESAVQELEVPTITVTLAEKEVGYNSNGHPDTTEEISILPLSRSLTAVEIDAITKISTDESRQNVVIVCGPEKMIEHVKTILTQIEVEEVTEKSWILTLY
ncbi:hypothetical protein BC936DRAFT_144100 [Jimgerdemannia flammicorona]|uniref:FAD-binding FR-type domain-containing protein n=1 Tax=Jimgerdemannia flammicorona TaxID=994334 RepID=A0A433DM51_9FUNG|nr:hypothetical protein BC936DRAFT_144100 [Jimgerdemannia flammicorona]